MLTPNYLPAAALQITEEEHKALIKVLGMLERNEFRAAPGVDVDLDIKLDEKAYNFNMGLCFKQHVCGTVGCIGGWVGYFMNHPNPDQYVGDIYDKGSSYPLFSLYYGSIDGGETPEQAAAATRNFLTSGEPRWQEVLGV